MIMACQKATRNRMVLDMIRYQDGIHPPSSSQKHFHYRIPFCTVEDNDTDIDKNAAVTAGLSQHYVCAHAITRLLHVGY